MELEVMILRLKHLFLIIILVLAVFITGCIGGNNEDKDPVTDVNNGNGENNGLDSFEYLNLSMNELLENPEGYLGKPVEITDAMVTARLTGNRYIINDNTTNYSIILSYTLAGEMFQIENILHVKGIFEQHHQGYWQVRVRNITTDTANYMGTWTTGALHQVSNMCSLFEAMGLTSQQFIEQLQAAFGETGMNNNGQSTFIDEDIGTIVLSNLVGVSIEEGDTVEARGILRYNPKGDYWDMEIRNDTGDYIKIVSKAPFLNYTIVVLTDLLSDADTFNGSNVEIFNVSILKIEQIQGGLKLNITDTSSADDLILLIPEGTDSPNDLSENDTVNIRGHFRNDQGGWHIYIRDNEVDWVKKNFQTEIILINE